MHLNAIIRRRLQMPFVALAVLALAGTNSAAGGDDFSHRIATLIFQLESPTFAERAQAAEELEKLAAVDSQQKLLASCLQRALIENDLTLEARGRLETVLGQLPAAAIPIPAIDAAEIAELLAATDADTYAERTRAARRLMWQLGRSVQVCEMLLALKAHLRLPSLGVESRRLLEPIYLEARRAWISSDPATWKLPPVRDAEIAALVQQLSASPPANAPATWRGHEIAQQELIDLLVRDDCLPRVRAAIETALQVNSKDQSDTNAIPTTALARLKDVEQYAMPGMVAEFWENGRHQGVQHLTIGVPNLPENAQRPSLFDRIDDRVAHCVSGNSLSPGDYPVGVAFPHPVKVGAAFHLVNLPTPRRRLLYEIELEATDEATRLKAISRRTLDAVLAQKRLLDDDELVLIYQLDRGEVAQFIETYFLKTDDGPVVNYRGQFLPAGRVTKHGAVCLYLAQLGIKEAVPGLLKAIKAERFAEPNADTPYDLPWLAVLAIAHRDPWPEVDTLLAELIDRREVLASVNLVNPELGATATALLLERHQQRLRDFSLEEIDSPTLQNLGCRGYRFTSPTGREAAQRWWQQRPKEAGSGV